ncbi:MAG: mannose-6-phosphate isomerase, class I [Desulfococcaceae bacterium]
MNEIVPLKNPVLPYAWGSPTAIPELLGVAADGGPQAEMWMGAHPKAPSTVVRGEREIPLPQAIAEAPEAILGPAVRARFGDALPFLFKVLAAAAPLSIQAHPSLDEARAGFDRENADGVPLDAPHRNYRDANHKPECIRALTPFWGLCGFRPPAEAEALLSAACGPDFPPLRDGLKAAGDSPLRGFFQKLMTLESDAMDAALSAALAHAEGSGKETPEGRWMRQLAEAYPGDPGVLSPLFLNLILLQPGEALFLPAGELHAYLDGVGVEIMANSDNVLRGGLTPKHVDVPELMARVRFSPRRPPVLKPAPVSAVEAAYETPADEFRLTEVSPTDSPADLRVESVEILLGMEDGSRLLVPDTGQALALGRGETLLVPAAVGRYTVSGAGRFFRASVPAGR